MRNPLQIVTGPTFQPANFDIHFKNSWNLMNLSLNSISMICFLQIYHLIFLPCIIWIGILWSHPSRLHALTVLSNTNSDRDASVEESWCCAWVAWLWECLADVYVCKFTISTAKRMITVMSWIQTLPREQWTVDQAVHIYLLLLSTD